MPADIKPEVVWHLMEIGATLHQDDPLFTGSMIMAQLFDKAIP